MHLTDLISCNFGQFGKNSCRYLYRKADLLNTTEIGDPSRATLQKQVPNITTAADSDRLILEGHHNVRLGNIKEALACFLEAAELNPNNAKAWHNCGLNLLKIGQYHDLALECFQRTIEINPKHSEAWNNMGMIFNHKGSVLDALTCYQRATEIMPGNSKAWKNLAQLYQKFGNNKAAKECLKRSDSQSPPWSRAMKLLQLSHYMILLRSYFVYILKK
jgi:tetratricopeptide (TPR) repeat protein